MQRHCDRWPVQLQCRVLHVSRSAYYKWRNSKPAAGALQRLKIAAEIRRIHADPRTAVYGSPRMVRELSKCGISSSRNTVARIMRTEGIRARVPRSFRIVTTDSQHNRPVAENLLNQEFSASRLNQIWLTDITYIRTTEGFTYLCTIQDLCSRRIVGWATSRVIDTTFVLQALNQAILFRSPQPGLIVHSDRGSQYAALAFQNRLSDCGFRQSMSRKGNCYDNAPMESFFRSFKVEEVYPNHYNTHEQATRAVSDYIDRFYNPQRLHSSLEYLSPMEFEQLRFRESKSNP
jgi:putative transposase